jgi:single-stranded DNA-binding protein
MSNVFSGACILSKDAEVRYLPSGMAVLRVRCANNIGFGDKQQTLSITHKYVSCCKSMRYDLICYLHI